MRAGAEAGDELGPLLILLRDVNTTNEPDWLMSRLNETKPIINAVRLATATVFVEGPSTILEPAKRVGQIHGQLYEATCRSSGSGWRRDRTAAAAEPPG